MFIAVFTLAGGRVLESGMFETEAQAQAFLDQLIAADVPLHSPLVVPAWDKALWDRARLAPGRPLEAPKLGAKG